MDENMQRWIDNATYDQLLARWRNAPIGSAWFQGEVGDYYMATMKAKREQVGDATHIAASKSIGWRP